MGKMRKLMESPLNDEELPRITQLFRHEADKRLAHPFFRESFYPLPPDRTIKLRFWVR
jgi:hypothetical protein